MTAQTLIAVDPAELQSIRDRLDALTRAIENVRMMPKPEWVTVSEYARVIDRSERTVLRRVEAGEIEAKHMGGVRMVRL